MKFNLGINKSRYSHNRDYHIDTTSDFGSFQPCMFEFLSPDDTLSVDDFRQLVRNGVMPAPTFGDIKCVNDFSFIPVRDVFPAFDALVSGQFVNTSNRKYIPASMPTVSSLDLVATLCCADYSRICVYYNQNSIIKPAAPSDPLHINIKGTLQSVITEIFPSGIRESSVFPAAVSGNVVYSGDTFAKPDLANPLNADFVLRNDKYTVCVRLNNAGKRLYKIFKGLGYSLDPINANRVSVLPIFAFYKAWYDRYFPPRMSNWQSTDCFKLIDLIYTYGYVDFLKNATPALWKGFISALSDCWYTYETDFVSANIDKPASNVQGDVNIPNTTMTSGSTYSNGIMSPATGQPYLWGSNGLITSAQLQLLSRLTRFVNKNSIIGGRVYEYLKVHFGQDAIDAMFRQSNFLGSFVTDVKLDDTYSQADTLNLSSGTGQALGSRAGLGSGFSNFSLKYDAPCHGFVIGMSAIYANSSFCQGDDPIMYMLKRFEVPTPEFDALGYELTPKAVVYDNGGYADSKRDALYNSSFGYVPTYSKLKYKRNILNGDMSKRSTRDSFLGFHLDRFITEKSPIFKKGSDGNYTIISDVKYNVPQAGDAWRYILKYPHLSYFNRIFLNSGSLNGGVTHIVDYPDDADRVEFDYMLSYDKGDNDDNFTIQCSVNVTLWNKLKPLSISFDTMSDEDNDSVTVRNN